MAKSHWLAHRAFHKSLNDLVNLRSQRRKTKNGFEAQNRTRENPDFEAPYVAEVDRLLENHRPEVAKASA